MWWMLSIYCWNIWTFYTVLCEFRGYKMPFIRPFKFICIMYRLKKSIFICNDTIFFMYVSLFISICLFLFIGILIQLNSRIIIQIKRNHVKIIVENKLNLLVKIQQEQAGEIAIFSWDKCYDFWSHSTHLCHKFNNSKPKF